MWRFSVLCTGLIKISGNDKKKKKDKEELEKANRSSVVEIHLANWVNFPELSMF